MKLKLFIIFFLIINTALCQKNFIEGYIILKGSSDTLKGKIDDRGWSYNPDFITFLSADSKEKGYRTNELKAFGLYDKEYYEVKTVDLDITPFQLGLLSNNPQILLKKDTTIALMVLLKADHQLSSFLDRMGKTHFFYQNKFNSSELINHRFIQTSKEGSYVIHNKIYQKQLDTLFRTCTKKLTTASVNYTTKDLVNIFTDFNECVGCTSTCYIKKRPDKNTVSLSFVAGVDMNSVSQNILEKDNKVFQDKSMHTDMVFGFGATIGSKRSKGSNNIYTELLFKKNKVANEYYRADFLEFMLSGIFRKQFINYPNLKVFGGVGVGIRYIHSTGVDLTPLTAPNGEWHVLDYNKTPTDGLIEIGFEISRFQIFNRLRYSFNNPSSVHTLLLHQNTVEKGSFTNQFCISYHFLRKKKDLL